MSDAQEPRRGTTVGRSYTAGRRQPYLIRKWPGSRWTLPLGPYTLTQLCVMAGTVFLLIKTRGLWAHFGPVNLIIGVGLPAALTYAARRTRIEGRDPLRAALSAAGYLLQPRAGYLRGRGWRTPDPVRVRGRSFVVADLPALDLPVTVPAAAGRDFPARLVAAAHPGRRSGRPAAVRSAATREPERAVSLAELLAAAETGGH